MIQIIRILNMTIAFLLELGLFASVGYWGFLQGKTTFTKYACALFLITIVLVLWGVFAAPKSEYRLNTATRIVFELCLFTVGSYMIYKTGHTTLAICFWVLALVNEIMAYLFKQ